MPRRSSGRGPSTPPCSRPSWARSPSHRLTFSAVSFTPRVRRRGLVVLPFCPLRWLYSWVRRGPHRLYTLLASCQKHRETRGRKGFTRSSINTAPPGPIPLLHYLLPSCSRAIKERNLQLLQEVYQMESAFPRDIYSSAHDWGPKLLTFPGHLPLLSPNLCKIDSSGHLPAHPTETGRVEVTHGCHGPSDTMSHRMLSHSARSLGSRGRECVHRA